MKRGISFALLVMILLVSSFALVSAQGTLDNIGETTGTVLDDFSDFIKPFSERLLGKTPGGEFLFAKILFLIIIYAIVWTALSRIDIFRVNTWVLVVVSLAASILATRWLTTEALINTLILPYTTLGIAISAALPFVIWFMMINVGLKEYSSTLRRVAWIFFAVIFVGLWATRYTEHLKDSPLAWIYPVTIVLALIVATMDGTISRFFVKVGAEKALSQTKVSLLANARRDMATLQEDLARGIRTEAEYKKEMDKIKRRMTVLAKG